MKYFAEAVFRHAPGLRHSLRRQDRLPVSRSPLPEPRTGPVATTVAELERHWEAARAGERGPAAHDPDVRLRAAYAEIGSRLRAVAAHPRVTQPGLSGVQSEVLDILAISRVISAELARSGDASHVSHVRVPVEMVQDAVDDVARRLDRLDAVLALLGTVAREARELVQSAEELFVRRRPSADPFRRLAAHFLADVRELSSADDVLLPTAFELEDWLSEAEGIACPSAIASAVLTARVVGWSASHFAFWVDRLETLVLAALLQDISLVYLETRRRHVTEEQRAELQRLHPRASACLAAGLSELSIDLPLLIAQHHERIDGSGAPKGLSASALGPGARWLSTATRLVELVRCPSDGRLPALECASARVQAGEQLWREAKRGEFDRGVTLMLLQTLGDTPRDEDLFEGTANRSIALTTFGARMFRRDPAETGIPSPHTGVTGDAPRSLSGMTFRADAVSLPSRPLNGRR